MLNLNKYFQRYLTAEKEGLFRNSKSHRSPSPAFKVAWLLGCYVALQVSGFDHASEGWIWTPKSLMGKMVIVFPLRGPTCSPVHTIDAGTAVTGKDALKLQVLNHAAGLCQGLSARSPQLPSAQRRSSTGDGRLGPEAPVSHITMNKNPKGRKPWASWRNWALVGPVAFQAARDPFYLGSLQLLCWTEGRCYICHIFLSFPSSAVTSREQTPFLVGGEPPASGLCWWGAAVGLHQGTWAHTGLQLAKYQK